MDREIPPNEKGQIKTTLSTNGRVGNLKKTINVNTNDPNNPVIILTLQANVHVELVVNPSRLDFKEMKMDELKNEEVELKNASNVNLEILPIKTDNENIKIEPIDKSLKWPVELKPNETLKLLATLAYKTENKFISSNVRIKYTGGEATDVFLRIIARSYQEPDDTVLRIKQPDAPIKDPRHIRTQPLNILPTGNKIQKTKDELPPAFEDPNNGNNSEN